MELYADIILPIALQPLTYLVPAHLAGTLCVGDGVEVTIGARKRYMGIVLRLHNNRPDYKRIKPVERVLYGDGLVSEMQLALWQWIADYYMCTEGEVTIKAMGESTSLRALETLLLPAEATDIVITGNATLLEVYTK